MISLCSTWHGTVLSLCRSPMTSLPSPSRQSKSFVYVSVSGRYRILVVVFPQLEKQQLLSPQLNVGTGWNPVYRSVLTEVSSQDNTHDTNRMRDFVSCESLYHVRDSLIRFVWKFQPWPSSRILHTKTTVTHDTNRIRDSSYDLYLYHVRDSLIRCHTIRLSTVTLTSKRRTPSHTLLPWEIENNRTDGHGWKRTEDVIRVMKDLSK